MKQRKIDRLIMLKAKVFDTVRKLEELRLTAEYFIKDKEKDLKELQELEKKLVNRYPRAKKLVNK